MKLRFRHNKAEPRIEPRSEPIAAMIKRVADEQRQRAVAGPSLTPAKAIGESERPRAAAPRAAAPQAAAPRDAAPRGTAAAAPTVPEPVAPDPAPPLTLGVAEAIGGEASLATCARGHRFARLSDHPTLDGIAACPHCMTKTLGDYRKIFAAIVRPVRYE